MSWTCKVVVVREYLNVDVSECISGKQALGGQLATEEDMPAKYLWPPAVKHAPLNHQDDPGWRRTHPRSITTTPAAAVNTLDKGRDLEGVCRGLIYTHDYETYLFSHVPCQR